MPQMTTGEMNKWTKRFNQIMGAAQAFKYKRLSNLRDDLVLAYEGHPYDPYAGFMFAAITEELVKG